MTYKDFQALCESAPAKANARCGRAMGWTLSGDGYIWCRDGECLRGANDEEWDPICDRNHAAMMVEKVVATCGAGAISLGNVLAAASGIDPDTFGAESIYRILVFPPSLIAYCALVALEKEEM